MANMFFKNGLSWKNFLAIIVPPREVWVVM